ncbi:sodium:calcium antiporter [Jeotgalibacillus proteolyticus]|uniref:Cation transporter n=1 Tax=Jeotgalibacillus proteolyticus TaxID=2082395 RepID=A0A2S5G6Q6_9BACL|nr:sodium:calcium antiporter [Jeotgalibacillus proteolyticus]PPA68666.1 cation transporter [Jeotgalibacillus proteolyticus]PPA68743.1 cation transporter [Jeotgalibacillus proteolyticus]
MAFIWFILAAVVTVYAAMKLSAYADVISTKTAMGGLLVGTLLLAGATSLPEVTTSLSAVLIGNNDIAIGNVLGSNLFNIFILACFDLYYRKKKLFLQASNDHLYTAGLGLLLTLLVMVALTLRIDYTILGLGIDSLLIVVIYGAGILIIGRLSKTDQVAPQTDDHIMTPKESVESALSVKHAVIGFIIAAIVIMGAGTVLSIMGDQIAVITGLGSSFIGSFLVAATTSLPEAVSVLVALRLKNINLAMGSILGSNIFNMLILAGSDLIYREGAIITTVSESHLTTAIGVTILSVIMILAVLMKKAASSFTYMMPSLLITVIYFVTSYLIFVNS